MWSDAGRLGPSVGSGAPPSQMGCPFASWNFLQLLKPAGAVVILCVTRGHGMQRMSQNGRRPQAHCLWGALVRAAGLGQLPPSNPERGHGQQPFLGERLRVRGRGHWSCQSSGVAGSGWKVLRDVG